MIVGTDPCTANVELSLNGGIDNLGQLVWDPAADFYEMQWEDTGVSDAALEAALCHDGTSGLIVEVCSANAPGGSHFVAVTGEVYDRLKDQCRFTVADPMAGCGKVSHSFLDDFDCRKSARRLFQ
jgi:hypothetical protein